MTPLVSILIPSYNHSKYILETLNSVFADTYENKEIVIIDDGSTDNSAALIENWKINNPNILVNCTVRENKGLCRTLNELVESANGKYLLLLASDDLLINNTIAERVAFLQDSKKMVIFSDAEVIDQFGAPYYDSMLFDLHKADKKMFFDDELLLDHITFNFFIGGAVVMMDKDIFIKIGKYQEDLKAEDLYFYLYTAAIKELAFFDRKVSKYRIHPTNTSNKVSSELTDAFIETYKRLYFKIPGIKRKMLVFKRLIGIILQKYRLIK